MYDYMPSEDFEEFRELDEQLNKAIKSKEPNDFQEFCNKVAEKSKNVTDSTLSLVYLSPDNKILEAVGRSGERVEGLEPTQIPFYRLDWDIAPCFERIYDGFTSWAALHIRPDNVGILGWDELRRHPAHKGQWDPIVWKGSPESQLHAIMFAPLCTSIKKNEKEYCKCFGLLKVELSKDKAPRYETGRFLTPFNEKQKENLKNLASWLCKRFGDMEPSDSTVFWKWFASRSAPQKTQHLMAILRNWRSAEYNITESLGFVLEFFRMLAGAEYGVLVLGNYHSWRDPLSETFPKQQDSIHIMPYWRPCWEDQIFSRKGCLVSEERDSIPRPAFRSMIADDLDGRKCLTFLRLNDKSANFLNNRLNERGKTGAIRKVNHLDIKLCINRDKTSSGVIIKISDIKYEGKSDFSIEIEHAWLVDLRVAHSDFGTIILSMPSEEDPDQRFASQAVSLARVLDRILGSEFGVEGNVCLPSHRPAGSRKLVIGFVDIRNFSTVTRILRLMGPDKLAAIELLMQHYTRVIAQLARDWGRLDRFVGDGAVLFFGEDMLPENDKMSNKSKEELRQYIERSVLVGVLFSIAALRAFEEIKKVWLEDKLSIKALPWRFPGKVATPLLENIKTDHCEDISLGLGIALNFGSVHMNYFGDTLRRDYSAIGDNMNLCARLCDEAGKYDIYLKRHMASILITQPIFEYLRKGGLITQEALNRGSVRLQPRGLGLDYPVWELFPSDLEPGKIIASVDQTRYKRIFENTFEWRNQDLDLSKKFIEKLALVDKPNP